MRNTETFSPHRSEVRDRTSAGAISVYRRHAARAMAEERWSVAEIFFDRILEVDPMHTEAWLMKGLLRQHCRQDDRAALECYQKVIRLGGFDASHPHVQRAQRSLGQLLALSG